MFIYIAGVAIRAEYCKGLVYGYGYSATNALITNWWPRKKGFIMGITTTGIMIASFTVVRWVSAIGNTYGFDKMMFLVSGLLIAFGVASTTVAFCIESGFAAVNVMSITAEVDVFGGLILGAVDTKWGPKTASLVGAVWVILSFFPLLVFTPYSKLWSKSVKAPVSRCGLVCAHSAPFTSKKLKRGVEAFVGRCRGERFCA